LANCAMLRTRVIRGCPGQTESPRNANLRIYALSDWICKSASHWSSARDWEVTPPPHPLGENINPLLHLYPANVTGHWGMTFGILIPGDSGSAYRMRGNYKRDALSRGPLCGRRLLPRRLLSPATTAVVAAGGRHRNRLKTMCAARQSLWDAHRLM
jgi:hypothetical protein